MNSWEQFVNENAKELEPSASEREKKENSAAAQRELFFQFIRKDGKHIQYRSTFKPDLRPCFVIANSKSRPFFGWEVEQAMQRLVSCGIFQRKGELFFNNYSYKKASFCVVAGNLSKKLNDILPPQVPDGAGPFT